jgi:hypothetical protein
MSTVKVGTKTGSVYEFDLEALAVRRVNNGEQWAELRKDSEWVQLLLEPEFFIGKPMYLALAPLSDEWDITMRETTPVVYIEEG